MVLTSVLLPIIASPTWSVWVCSARSPLRHYSSCKPLRCRRELAGLQQAFMPRIILWRIWHSKWIIDHLATLWYSAWAHHLCPDHHVLHVCCSLDLLRTYRGQIAHFVPNCRPISASDWGTWPGDALSVVGILYAHIVMTLGAELWLKKTMLVVRDAQVLRRHIVESMDHWGWFTFDIVALSKISTNCDRWASLLQIWFLIPARRRCHSRLDANLYEVDLFVLLSRLCRRINLHKAISVSLKTRNRDCTTMLLIAKLLLLIHLLW